MKKQLVFALSLLLCLTTVVSFVQAQEGVEKITGPWLWVIAPTVPCGADGVNSGTDFLAEASGGAVTELGVAADGANEGDAVGDHAWTVAEIADSGGNNLNDLVVATGLGEGDVNDNAAYGYIKLNAPKAQGPVAMWVGSDDFEVTIKKGENPLIVRVGECGGGWSMFVGFTKDDDDLKFNTNMPRQAVDATGKFATTWARSKIIKIHSRRIFVIYA